ncbi:phosphatidylinositol-glycan biosynthesis class F protein [Spea bombifrons]|uniref:phosphatidylinositol-glycan biosynthesis class F protein n=1 Tax=Spea bombifrons TaxID=233779 RepID=UPI00234A441F|nr:phosphatidylinositol-glycan biosynthesis class F protein [Spea bombifrons]
MDETELRRLSVGHVLGVLAVISSLSIPPLFLDNFSILKTHTAWLCICSVFVIAVNVVLLLTLKPNPSPKRISFGNKVNKFSRSCLYFFISCLLFHAIIVLYGAPLLESVAETFLFAVLLSSFTTSRCLCILGPNFHAWIRVFSRDGAMSAWDHSLQITTVCSVIGAWLGAFPIPLDWDRPWQVWPISCSLGATFGYAVGLHAAPVWIYWNRKKVTYKSR